VSSPILSCILVFLVVSSLNLKPSSLFSLPGQRRDRASSSIHPGRSLGRLSMQAGRRPTRLSDLRLPPRRAGPRRGLFCNSSWLRIHVHHKHISNSLVRCFLV
jgi:hypothetical protein